jgi:hypothetical protein
VNARVVDTVGAVKTNVGKLVVVAFTCAPDICTQLKPPGGIVPVSCVHVEPIDFYRGKEMKQELAFVFQCAYSLF